MARRPTSRRPDPNQLPLDFESRSRDRHAMLIHALTKTGTLKQAPLARLVLWCEERRGDALGMTRDEIGQRLGLVGSTVRRWVVRLQAAGVLQVVDQRRQRGGTRPPLLSIDWATVQELTTTTPAPVAKNHPRKLRARPRILRGRARKLRAPYKEYHPSIVLQSSTSSPESNPPASSEEVEELLAKIRRLLPAPLRLAEAIDAALAAGCTVEQLRQRCRWFQQHQGDWKSEHRKGVLYHGLAECRPDFADHQGWPYR